MRYDPVMHGGPVVAGFRGHESVATSAALCLSMVLGALGPALAQSTADARRPVSGAADSSANDFETCSAAAERGLRWLIAQQTESGGWRGDVGHKRGDWYDVFHSAEQQRQRGGIHVGVTALATLAFVAGGHLPDRGPHGDAVHRAVDSLLARIDDGGYVADSGTRMYSHAFATLCLAQLHGMVRSPALKSGLERAVQWIVDCQNQMGAWRYNPFTPEADLSVTVCQLQALRAAHNIGIAVPRATIDAAVEYVRASQVRRGPDRGLFYYKIAGRGAYRKSRQFAINAAALTSLFSAGVYDEQLSEPALEFLLRAYPFEARHPHHFYYWYGNYYAAQALFQEGGARYELYYYRLCRDLLATQQADGRWINDVGPGDAFATAVACLLLQVRNQYLPIFQR